LGKSEIWEISEDFSKVLDFLFFSEVLDLLIFPEVLDFQISMSS